MDKAALLGTTRPTDTVKLNDGTTVTVQALSKPQIEIAQKGKKTRDALFIMFGLIDPELNVKEVQAWFAAAPAGDPVKVLEKIAELSGLSEGAGKSDHREAE